MAHRFAHEMLGAQARGKLGTELQGLRALARAGWAQSMPCPDGTAFLGEHGFVRGLKITSPPPSGSLDGLVEHADAALLTYVEIEGPDALVTLKVLDAAGILARLQDLALCAGDGSDEVAAWITQAPSLRGLPHLTLKRQLVDNAGAAALAKGLPGLRSLDLTGNFIADDGAEALARAAWPDLSSLVLNDNEVGDVGAVALARAPWPALREMQLQRNEIGDDGVLALLKSSALPRLRVLTLASNPLGELAQRAFTEWRAT